MSRLASGGSIFDKSVSIEMKATAIEPASSLGSTLQPSKLSAAKKSQKA